MPAVLLATKYPRAIEPAELLQVVDDGVPGSAPVVAIGVNANLERRREWRELLDQLADREIELRWEGGTGAWEARVYTLADEPGPRILTPQEAHDAVEARVGGTLRDPI